jgi:ribosomal protein S18 acetylase RimI-like enzyme
MHHPDIHIAPPASGPIEQDPAIAVLMLAFSTDAAIRYMFPTAGAFIAAFPRMAAAMGGAALEAGAAFVADDHAAAALWLPPGLAPDGDAIAAVVGEHAPMERLEVLMQVGALMEEFHPKEPHWYLPMIGVDPSRQGQGYGSALLKAALKRCDADGLPAYLESSSPRNVPLYERHGFEVIGEIKPGDHPGITPMYRAARG